MSLKLSSTSIGSLYLGSTKVGEAYLGSTKIFSSSPVLPPYTIRLQFTEGVTPTFSTGTLAQVSSSPNLWDLTYNNTEWASLCNGQRDIIKVIGANTTGVTDMHNLFSGCSALISVPLFDTSSVTDMGSMFFDCTSLTDIPLFDTSSVTNMGFKMGTMILRRGTFENCYNVKSGALALYRQVSSQTAPPDKHVGTFAHCGENTVTGASELSQIPSSWGGTGA